MLSSFHLIPERNGRTDRRTDVLYQYRASVCWRAIKTIQGLIFWPPRMQLDWPEWEIHQSQSYKLAYIMLGSKLIIWMRTKRHLANIRYTTFTWLALALFLSPYCHFCTSNQFTPWTKAPKLAAPCDALIFYYPECCTFVHKWGCYELVLVPVLEIRSGGAEHPLDPVWRRPWLSLYCHFCTSNQFTPWIKASKLAAPCNALIFYYLECCTTRTSCFSTVGLILDLIVK